MLTLYLIHFEQKYEHARHYLGLSNDVKRRLEEHRSGQGNPLLKPSPRPASPGMLCVPGRMPTACSKCSSRAATTAASSARSATPYPGSITPTDKEKAYDYPG